MSHTYTTISNSPEIRSSIIHPFCYWDNAFTDEELKKITDYCSSLELSDGLAASVDKDKNVKYDVTPVRKSKVNFIAHSEELKWIFERLNTVIYSLNQTFYNFDINGYSHLQYTEYDQKYKGKYDYHLDMGLGERDRFEMRKLSLSMFLSDPSEYKGGKFDIKISDSGEVNVEQIKGRIVLFPSFVMHRVTPVTKGTRKSLVAWIEGPKFR